MFKMTFSSPLPARLPLLFFRAKQVFFRVFIRLFPIAFLATCVISIPDLLIRGATGGHPPVTEAAAASFTWSTLFLGLIGFFISSFFGPFLFDQVAALYQGENKSVYDSLQSIYNRIVPLLLGMFLASFCVVLGLVLCLLPGIFLFVVWSLYVPLCLFEKKSPLEALYLSAAWVWGSRRWWQTALLIFLPAGVILYINAILLGFLHAYWPLDLLVQYTISTFMMVFLVCILSVQYAHLKQYYPLAKEEKERKKAEKKKQASAS